MEAFNIKLISILILFAVSVGITAVAKTLKRPYPTALVISGLIVGAVHIAPVQSLYSLITQSTAFPIVILSIFLPTLLGEATLNMPVHHLLINKKGVFFLAFIGTLLTYIFIGALSYYIMGLSLIVAMVFGALMATTDPISVISILKSKGITPQLSNLLEGESLFNDGIGVVLFNMSVFYLLTWMDMGFRGLGEGLFMFLKFAIGGALVGGLLGFLISHLTKLYDDYPLEISFSIVLFFGAYFLAEEVHVSGVVAVVVAGLVFGSYGARIGMTPLTKMAIRSFWDVIAFIANSIIFFMLGLQINEIHFGQKWKLIIPAILIVLIARSLAVYMSLFRVPIPWKWKHLINWGGLKGSLSVALALSLPQNFAGRDTIQVLTFSMVIFSLIFQSWSLDPLIRWLKLDPDNDHSKEYEQLVANHFQSTTALEQLDNMRQRGLIDVNVYQDLKERYQDKMNTSKKQFTQLIDTIPELKHTQMNQVKRQLLLSEYQAVQDLLNDELISDGVGSNEKRKILVKLESLINNE